MRFFNRNRATTAEDAAPSDKAHPSIDHFFNGFGGMPSVGQWLKAIILDVITMIILGAIGLGLYFAKPAPYRSFPIFDKDGDIVYPQIAYPLRKEIIPIWAVVIIAVFVPPVVFLICQIRVRSFWDLNNAGLGLLYSIICSAVFEVFIKFAIGGLRPHFLEVCQPDLNAIQGKGNGFQQIMYDRTICTGDQADIDDSLKAFPSGHSTAAFASLVYLSLYLNGKLKVFANYHPAMWKLVAIYAPILGATLIAGALTVDEFHNWYDCVAGAIIGTLFAFSSYRMVYASIWDFRFNHIPLNRTVGFIYADGQPEFNGFRDSLWTRRAGWGNMDTGFGTGCPGDATGAFGGRSGVYTGQSISRRPVAGPTMVNDETTVV